jgi:hypothetical protein
MVRRLLVLLLALALVPASLPSASRGAATARRNGPFAERTSGLVQVVSLTEPPVLHALPLRTTGRNLRVVPADSPAPPIDRRSEAARIRPHGFGVLGAGFALVPLRM